MNPANLMRSITQLAQWCGRSQNLPFTILIVLSAISLISRLILVLK